MPIKALRKEDDMADEEIRTDEDPEVEGHGNKPDIDEGNHPMTEDEEPEVEGHGFHPGMQGGNKPDPSRGNKP
jgi:hypothetical protein